ncbi:MAG: T9SS type A sorting domain-containing protein [Bacteroidetes bacterium]|nr:T9SS type A sorting domain-containing protein [Bacteroidota bacterium]
MNASKTILLLTFLTISLMNVYGQSLISIDLNAHKLLYDGKRDKIYATVKSLDMNYGNNFVQINPRTGLIEKSMFVGSEPSCMDITKDTNFVYIGFDGASLVKRINLNTFLVDRTIPLGNGPFGPRYAEDVATISTTPDVVVVSRKRMSVTPRHDGVVAYLNSTKIPGETPNHTGSNVIESADDTSLVFGYNNESSEYGFRRMRIDTITGVNLIDVTQGMSLGLDFEFEKGLLYSDRGKILDPFLSPPTFVGNYANISWDYAVQADFENNTTFFCTISNGLQIRRYNLQTMALKGVTNLDNAFPNTFQLPVSSDMIRYSEGGLAFIVHEDYFENQDRRVILYSSCLFKDGSNLSISKVLANPLIHKNDVLDLKIIVTNKGVISAESVLLRDTLNSTFEVISTYVSSGNIQNTANHLEWTIDEIQPNQSDTAIIKIHFTQQGDFPNTIHTTTTSFECDDSDNIFYDTLKVQSPVGIQSLDKDKRISFFPNPISDYLNAHFSLKEASMVVFRIMDSNGKVVFSEEFQGEIGNNYRKIDFKMLNKGIYTAMIETNNYLSEYIKIVKM